MTEQEWQASTDPAAMLDWVLVRTGQRPSSTRHVEQMRIGRGGSDRKLRLFAVACHRASPPRSPELMNRAIAEVEALADGLRESLSEEVRLGCGSLFDLSTIPHWLSLSLWAPDLGDGLEQHAEQEANRKKAAHILREIIGNPWRPVAFLKPGDKLKMLTSPKHRLVPAQEGDRVAATVLSIDGDKMRVKPAYSDILTPATPGVWDVWRPDWLTPQVLTLANAAYGERRADGTLDPVRLAVLCDAMEEAGCVGDKPCIHCQGKGVHETGFVRCDLKGIHDSRQKIPCVACQATGTEPYPLIAHLRSPGPHYRGCHAVDAVLGLS